MKLSKIMKGLRHGGKAPRYAKGGKVEKREKKHEREIEIEGKAAKPRLDRPAHRVDGGPSNRGAQGPGELANAEQERYLRQKAENIPPSVGNLNALESGAGIGTAIHMLARSRMPVPIRGLAGALGLTMAGHGAKNALEDFDKMKEGVKAQGELDRYFHPGDTYGPPEVKE